MKKTILVLPVILIGIAAATFFLYKDNSLINIQESETIRIGYSIEAPYAFLNPKGEVTGLSTMEAKEIANRLGIKNIEWTLMEFGSLINELESDKIDIIASGMFITNERAKRINFSEPTLYINQGLLVAKGNPKKLFSYEQALSTKDCKMAAIGGSIEELLLRNMGFSGGRLVLVPDVASGKVAIETGLATGLALSLPTLRWMTNNDKTALIEIVTAFKQPSSAIKAKLGYGAVLFQKKDGQLQKAWNKELKLFIGSPKHLELLTKFGFSQDELPGGISAEEILKH